MPSRRPRGTVRGAALLALPLTFAACGVFGRQPPSPAQPPTVIAPAGRPPGTGAGYTARGAEPAPSAAVPEGGATTMPPAPLGLAAKDAGTAGPPEATGSTTAQLNSLLRQLPTPAPDADLPVGPGDLIEVSVFEVDELSKIKIRIPLKGVITLPLIGQIPAAGRSAVELQDEISERLQKKYMHNPQVSVFVHEHQSQRVSMMGAVRKGGVYALTSRLRLADALAMAEGLADDADHTVFLIRRVPLGTVLRTHVGLEPPKTSVPPLPGATEEVMVAISLDELAGGRQELNVPLQAGDVVYVPRAGSYWVGGSVEKPGPFLLKSKTTIQQAVTAAGGPKDVADWEDIRLYRMKPGGEREVLAFSLNDIEKGQAPPEVQKHDVIVVGKSQAKAFWYGVYDFFKGILGVSKPL